MKTSKQLERYFKGAANHRRLDILRLISNNTGMTLEKISSTLRCNLKTVSEHTRRLVQAGLLNKTYKGREVAHSLSPYGRGAYLLLIAEGGAFLLYSLPLIINAFTSPR